jgi:hypothetical protein
VPGDGQQDRPVRLRDDEIAGSKPPTPTPTTAGPAAPTSPAPAATSPRFSRRSPSSRRASPTRWPRPSGTHANDMNSTGSEPSWTPMLTGKYRQPHDHPRNHRSRHRPGPGRDPHRHRTARGRHPATVRRTPQRLPDRGRSRPQTLAPHPPAHRRQRPLPSTRPAVPHRVGADYPVTPTRPGHIRGSGRRANPGGERGRLR